MHDPARYRPTERFSDRAEVYARARPGYPPELVAWLVQAAALAPGSRVAEFGSGTGLFTRELLSAGCVVDAVEPNAAMRAVAESAFAGEPRFISRDGSAEASGLAEGSVVLVAAAQAFHWFVAGRTRAETRRILAPGGQAALIWNVRRLDSAFAQGYEALLLRHCADYAAGQPHQADDADIAEFFTREPPRSASFFHAQPFDLALLQARLLSSSYTPKAGDPAREPLLAELAELFARHAQAGRVAFEYDARIYLGRP